MTKKWIITVSPDRDGNGGGKALVHSKEDLDRRKAEAKKAGVNLTAEEH